MNQKIKILIYISISIAFTLICIGYWYFFSMPFVKTDDARISADIIKIASNGVSGKIEKAFIKEGDIVKKGDILINIEQDTLQAQFERAKAKNEFANKEFERMQKLYKQTNTSQKDLDLAKLNANISSTEFSLASIALKNSILKSPIDGVIINKTAVEGNILEQGQTAIIIADIKNAWVSANVPENKVSKIKNGQPVDISIDEGGYLKGKVENVRAATSAQFALIPNENTSGNYIKIIQRIPVKIRIINNPSNKQLKIGQSVKIKIHIK